MERRPLKLENWEEEYNRKLISIEEAANAALADIQSPFRVEQLLLNEGFILIEGRRE